MTISPIDNELVCNVLKVLLILPKIGCTCAVHLCFVGKVNIYMVLRRAVHSSHQFFGEVTNQITNFKSPIFLFQVIKMCCMIQL